MPALALVLAGCSGGAEETGAVADHSDPLMAAALAGPIMIDADMVDRNGANQLASFADADGSMPRPDVGPEAAARARAQALELVGGSVALRPVPEPADGAPAADPALARCAGQARPGFRWAAVMPQAFPVYPQGAVLEAAGSDAPGCRFRAVSFATAVAVEDVLAFYATRASASGYGVQHTSHDGENVLAGGGSDGRLQVRVRAGEGGLTEVDLVTLES
ncbi:hypothetical protein [Alteraurantiacibacter buctensis]|uniref:Uncharacterized protein n=1 Tax=Alteraurantiacibacter buctensis TaxID=1503981 RepID=A0A844YSI2_9SPHN|nr:hypothetical protein [Alteraurantiacibacter buctensis]MXO71305.1 hypothetical protein [Alteraurantiacibacter buctensis]